MDLPSACRSLYPPLKRRYEADFLQAATEFDNEVRLAREAGMLLEPEEFRTQPAPPAKDNAATYLRQLGDITSAHPELVDLARDPRRLGEYALVAQHREDAVNAAWQASVCRGCDFGWDGEAGPPLPFKEFPLVRAACHILSATARVLAGEGCFQDAHRLLAGALRIGDYYADCPLLMPHLVRIGCEITALSALYAMVAKMPRPEDQIAELRMMTGEIHPQAVARSYQGEGMIPYWHASQQPPSATTVGKTGPLDREGPTWTRAVVARALARNRMIYEAGKAAGPDSGSQARAMAAVSAKSDQDKRPATTAGAKRRGMVTGSLGAFIGRDAHVRLLSAFAHLLEYRQSEDRFPAQLPDWGKDSEDPFAPGRQLGYRRDGEGFVLYTSGTSGRRFGMTSRNAVGLGKLGPDGTVGLRYVPGREATL